MFDKRENKWTILNDGLGKPIVRNDKAHANSSYTVKKTFQNVKENLKLEDFFMSYF